MSIRRLVFWRDEDGSALLEGAIVIPVLFALVVGTLEFSFIFFEQHVVSTGVRDAARYLARTSNPMATAAQTAAQNLASTGSVAGGSARRITGFDPSGITFSFQSVDNSLDAVTGQRPYREATVGCGGPDDVIVITATGTFTHSALGFLAYFGISPPTITVTQSERCIGIS